MLLRKIDYRSRRFSIEAHERQQSRNYNAFSEELIVKLARSRGVYASSVENRSGSVHRSEKREIIQQRSIEQQGKRGKLLRGIDLPGKLETWYNKPPFVNIHPPSWSFAIQGPVATTPGMPPGKRTVPCPCCVSRRRSIRLGCASPSTGGCKVYNPP